MQPSGRPPATTFEYLESVALREPRRLALVSDDRGWSYQDFYSDLLRAVRVLDGLGVRRGQRVAVGILSFHTSMLMLLAAETLGAVTTYFIPERDPDVEGLFPIVDWVVSDRPQAVGDAAKFVQLDDAFARRFLAAEPVRDGLPLVVPQLGDPARLIRTSGSSGRSKFMVLSRHAQEYWVNSARTTFAFTNESRLLILGPLVMNGMFSRASACLRVGAVPMGFTDETPPERVVANPITHIASMPVHLRILLDGLPGGWVAPRPVDLYINGGFAPPELREKVARVFRGRIFNRYGTNEAGAVSDDLDEKGNGVVAPGVDLRIIDPDGSEKPRGELGMIAVRTPSMVEGYVGEPEATRTAFRDGWFVSGDWGSMTGERTLRLAGRHDDLVNIGGIKYPANDIQAGLRKIVQVSDCAVLATNLRGGHATIGVALVVPGGQAHEPIVRQVNEFFKQEASVLFVNSIPFLPNGKVDRRALHRLFDSLLGQGGRQ